MMSRTGSTSSASTQLQLEQTDLDTDEEMGADRNSLAENIDNRKQNKKKDHYGQCSRAATPVSKLLTDDAEGEKMIKSSSFDNLQEAFKRSLKLNGRMVEIKSCQARYDTSPNTLLYHSQGKYGSSRISIPVTFRNGY